MMFAFTDVVTDCYRLGAKLLLAVNSLMCWENLTGMIFSNAQLGDIVLDCVYAWQMWTWNITEFLFEKKKKLRRNNKQIFLIYILPRRQKDFVC